MLNGNSTGPNLCRVKAVWLATLRELQAVLLRALGETSSALPSCTAYRSTGDLVLGVWASDEIPEVQQRLKENQIDKMII